MDDAVQSVKSAGEIPIGASEDNDDRPFDSDVLDKCPSCGPVTANQRFVYALGRIVFRFPNMGLEREYAQIQKGAGTAGLTNGEVDLKVISDPQNRYLARQLCWVMVIEGLDTYVLIPRDPADLDLVLKALRPAPSPWDVDLVIGRLGPLASPAMCNGLTIPMVGVDQIYSFDRDALVKSIPRPKDASEKQDKRFAAIAATIFETIMQMADNAGATDDHRAVNYLAVRYPGIYGKAAELYAQDAPLTAVEVRQSRLSGVRKVVDVIISFTNRQTADASERWFVRVDVTEEFPFVVSGMARFFDR